MAERDEGDLAVAVDRDEAVAEAQRAAFQAERGPHRPVGVGGGDRLTVGRLDRRDEVGRGAPRGGARAHGPLRGVWREYGCACPQPSWRRSAGAAAAGERKRPGPKRAGSSSVRSPRTSRATRSAARRGEHEPVAAEAVRVEQAREPRVLPEHRQPVGGVCRESRTRPGHPERGEDRHEPRQRPGHRPQEGHGGRHPCGDAGRGRTASPPTISPRMVW